MLGKFIHLSVIKNLSAAVIAITALGLPQPAQAGGVGLFPIPYTSAVYNCDTGVGCCTRSRIDNLIHEMFTGTGQYTGQEDLQKYFYTETFFPAIETALKKTADEIRNASMFYVAAVGAMIDGQNMNKTLLALQKQNTDTLQNETVSDQICRFGTLSRSLAHSGEKSRTVQLALAAEMQNRQLMVKNMNSGTARINASQIGRSADKQARFEQFKSTFCEPTDSGADLGATPKNGGAKLCPPGVTNDMQQNRDVDMTRTLSVPLTLDVDFAEPETGPELTIDEENLFALSSNLYAHNLGTMIGESDLKALRNKPGPEADTIAEKLLNFRAVVAKRSVAQNSFAALAGMKAAGPKLEGGAEPNSVQYMKEILKELGLVEEIDLTAAIGEQPSYYAQMDMLTRKLYQSPRFYANLMESPTNVGRQQAAIAAIELMQDRDIYESLRRSEMLLSTMLEIYVARQEALFKDKGVKS